MRCWMVSLCFFLLGMPSALSAISKPHVIAFGKWTTVKLFTGPDEDKPLDLKVRPLYIDGKQREFTFGPPHEITERLFVVRRIIRVNDALSQEATARWSWQRGGWLVVDRGNGHISPANLPEYDPENSATSWYRDYVAYFGISDDGRKLSAVVRQLGRRKPILKKSMGGPGAGGEDPEFSVPVWQRQPARVTFVMKDEKYTYAVRGHIVEVENNEDDDSE